MPFTDMGITVTVDQFNELAQHVPAFRARLREWSLDSPDAIATLITARIGADLAALVRAHPESDFLIPGVYREAVRSAPHEAIGARGGLSSPALAHAPKPQFAARLELPDVKGHAAFCRFARRAARTTTAERKVRGASFSRNTTSL